MRLLCLAAALLLELVPATVLYVSSAKGSDSNSGTSPSAPLRSISNAFEAVRHSPNSRILVSGKFYLNETLEIRLGPAGLVVEQWQGHEEAILSGGEVISPSAWTQGADGIWSASVSNFVANALAAKGLGNIFVNGKARSIVRTKMKSWAQPLVNLEKEDPKRQKGFVVPPGDIDPSWSLHEKHVAQWRVAVFHSFTKAYHTVASVLNNTLRFKEEPRWGYDGSYDYCSRRRYYIEGIPELPLLPGNWRLEPGGRRLSYLPVHGEKFPEALVVVPVLSTLVSVINTPSFTLQNVVLEHAFGGDCGNDLGIACDRETAMMASNALSVSNSKSARISDVIIREVGAAALHATSSPGVVIERVGVVASGGPGIRVDQSKGALVNNSIVEGYGARFPAGVGIDLSNSPNGTVSHCDVCCGFFTGIGGGGSDDSGEFSSFVFNHVHDIGSEEEMGICDFGGYHGANSGSKNPIFVTSNIFEKVTAYANGGAGIYMDVSSAGYQVSRNLVHSVSGSPVIWNINKQDYPNEGTVTRITNNVLIANQDNAYSRKLANQTRDPFVSYEHKFWGAGNPVFSWMGHTTAELEHNVIVVDTSHSPSRGEWFGGRPCARDLNQSSDCTMDYGNTFKKLKSDRNVWHNASSPTGQGDSRKSGLGPSRFPGGCKTTDDMWKTYGFEGTCRSWTEWMEFGKETSSRWVDPVLKGPLKLVSEPKALALGIHPLHELVRAGVDWTLPGKWKAHQSASKAHPNQQRFLV